MSDQYNDFPGPEQQGRRRTHRVPGLDILVNNAAYQLDEFGADTPLGRAGQPAELAAAYGFLASDDSSYITGRKPLP